MQEGTVTREPESRARKSQVADSEALRAMTACLSGMGKWSSAAPELASSAGSPFPPPVTEGPSLVRAVGFLEGAGSRRSNLGRPCREAARVVQAGNTHLNEYSFPEGDGEPWRKIILVIRQRVDWSTWEQEHGPNFYR